jgi:hypothetical protein
MKANDDGRSVKLDIKAVMTTYEIEKLIRDLAELRAVMSPPVSIQPSNRRDAPEHYTQVSLQEEPYLEARQLVDGRIRLWVRNAGIGWMAFNLPVAKAQSLRDYFVANVNGNSVLAQDLDDVGAAHGVRHTEELPSRGASANGRSR